MVHRKLSGRCDGSNVILAHSVSVPCFATRAGVACSPAQIRLACAGVKLIARQFTLPLPPGQSDSPDGLAHRCAGTLSRRPNDDAPGAMAHALRLEQQPRMHMSARVNSRV